MLAQLQTTAMPAEILVMLERAGLSYLLELERNVLPEVFPGWETIRESLLHSPFRAESTWMC